MSRENVEIVRRLVEVFNAEGVGDAMTEFIADDFEFHDPPEAPSPRIARGREEARAQFDAFNEVWAKHWSELHEVRSVGPDKVLTLSVEHFIGRDGIEVEAESGSIFTLRDGKLIRWETFWNQQAALEALPRSE